MPVNEGVGIGTPEGVENLDHGVWEWTSSYYPDQDENYQDITSWNGEGLIPEGKPLVLRGGSVGTSIPRITYRLGSDPYRPGNYFGVRCVADN
jgi:formylglycine-generating enzyme required for sulfatase activity